jgi:hypothetical protein
MPNPKLSWKENFFRPGSLIAFAFYLLSLWANPAFHAASQTHFHIKNWYIPRADLMLIFLFCGVLASLSTQRSKIPKKFKLWMLIPLVGIILWAYLSANLILRTIHNTLVMSGGEQQLSPLELAAYHGDLLEVQKLVKNQTDAQSRNQVSKTALHFACGASPVINQEYKGSPQVAEYLISHGADVNAQDAMGNTALMDAIANHNLECVQVLLSHHANIELKTQSGKSAVDQAKIYKDEPILQALLKSQKSF